MTRFSALLSALLFAGSASAAGAEVLVEDAFARSSGPTAKTGAAFMVLTNTGASEDRLIAVASEAAERVEIHTHVEDANGIMRMIKVEDGIAVPAGESTMLKRGGDHVMFMGLRQPFADDAEIEVTLTFEQAGDITVAIPVDNDRKPAAPSN